MRLAKRNKRSTKSSTAQPTIVQTEDPDQHINMFDSDDVSMAIFGDFPFIGLMENCSPSMFLDLVLFL